MVSPYSPQGDAGGTLHFPSPSQIRHVNAASAFKQLRRSLSRSPSRGPMLRLIPSKSASPSPSSPLSPTPGSSQIRSASTGLVPSQNGAQSSPSGYSLSANGVRKTLSPKARKRSPMRPALRSRSSQRSPRKPSLTDSSDNGNAMPPPSASSSDDTENRVSPGLDWLEQVKPEYFLRASGSESHPNTIAPHRATVKFEKNNGNLGTAKSSPLKRSDGIMNLDQRTLGSPAKRRSVHGPSSDFDIFVSEAASQSHNELPNTKDVPSAPSSVFSEFPNAISPLPRRTSTLRRTTMQQRLDKPLFGRAKQNSDIAFESVPTGAAGAKGRSRVSLDGSLAPPMNRDSPFASQGSLPNASAHPMIQTSSKPPAMNHQSRPQRHPLSRTITQSSSNSSIADDSPTHIPIRQPENRRPAIDFSKTLAIGARRPGSSGATSSYPSTEGWSNDGSFSTPEDYKQAKPYQAAFMSTGLISKRHKHLDDSQSNFNTSQMPNTPCKPHTLLAMSPNVPGSNDSAGKIHQARHSFGTPSTPFSPLFTPPTPATLGKNADIFGSSVFGAAMNRRSSFRCVRTDDLITSSPTNPDSQSSNECDLPPTPTKQALTSRFNSAPGALEQGLSREDLRMFKGVKEQSGRFNQERKSILHLLKKPSGSVDGDSDNTVDNSPSVGLRLRSSSSVPSSFTRSRFLRDCVAPSPLLNISCRDFAPPTTRPQTKSSSLSPASPNFERRESLSPCTPREAMIPPDPSGLSISGHVNRHSTRSVGSNRNSTSTLPPATPTASRDDSASFGKELGSYLSSYNNQGAEVNSHLRSKFDKVELIGTGEFSFVYRVTKDEEPTATPGYFAHQGSPATTVTDRVWAVKRVRHPYSGRKDRLRKQREVVTLKALGQNDHTVFLVDSWDHHGHLYIQTEFCEEGSLDRFLAHAGFRARLDDFRIWKILLELSLGLKHIHDCDFIHLDLKPANVLITFEGVLKIGDFGMASPWPPPVGMDAEGDREYIGPEILAGHFGKPSDIFSLGLIILEIAGNVVLPDNGASWQRLRTGDISDVPSLTWSSETSVSRDSSGVPLSEHASTEDVDTSNSGDQSLDPVNVLLGRHEQKELGLHVNQLVRVGELAFPPAFMINANDPGALERVVCWMISPRPSDRPSADDILETIGVHWTRSRRRSGATIYEGNYGPADDVLTNDAEMMDV